MVLLVRSDSLANPGNNRHVDLAVDQPMVDENKPAHNSGPLSIEETRTRLEALGSRERTPIFIAQLIHESGLSPSADNGADRGIAQINRRSHPDITDDQAFDVAWSLRWYVKTMQSNIDNFGVRAGLAAYNAGIEGMHQGRGFGYADAILRQAKRYQ